MAKKPTPKMKKISFSLSNRDYMILNILAQRQGEHPKIVLRKILHERLLQEGEVLRDLQPENQIGLFDTPQIDIFDDDF